LPRDFRSAHLRENRPQDKFGPEHQQADQEPTPERHRLHLPREGYPALLAGVKMLRRTV
jgi:hypothetical protein